MEGMNLALYSTADLKARLDSILEDVSGWIRTHEAELRQARDLQHHAEYLVVLQRDLAQSLCTATSEQEIVSRALDSMLLVNGYDCGGAYLLRDDCLELITHRNLSEEFVEQARRYCAGSSQYELVMQGAPIFRRYDTFLLDGPRATEGLKCIAIIPFKYGDRVMGCFNVASHHIDEADEASMDSLVSICAHVGEVLHRANTANHCRLAKAQLEILAEASTDAIAIMDGRVIARCNSALASLLGASEAELAKSSISDHIHPDDLAIYARHELKHSGDPFQIRLVRPDSPPVTIQCELQFLHQKEVYENCIVLVAHEWKPR